MRNRQEKAISPIIAAVILIALVVAIGGVVSSWVYSFVTENTHTDTCGISTTYSVSDASFNQTSGQLMVKVKNSGKNSIFNFTLEADNGTVIIASAALSPSPSYELGTGMSQYIIANLSSQNITAIRTVKVLVASCRSYSPSPVIVANI